MSKYLLPIGFCGLVLSTLLTNAYVNRLEEKEGDDLADCLNRVATVSEGFKTCVNGKRFKGDTALILAHCIQTHRNVTDIESSPWIIEHCYNK